MLSQPTSKENQFHLGHSPHWEALGKGVNLTVGSRIRFLDAGNESLGRQPRTAMSPPPMVES
ncbi:hypothetical protein TIFTF001_041325 [Ficus carica]|uniref:Uncharacterized protein n=1 Tax=Ficus carica TaxID=3494 RepID=A0AA87ZB14_FICCA|nr:hypothetical protein TIFTF001_041325 [Ficus carica]